MSKATSYRYYDGAEIRVPFAEVTSPMNYMGEAICTGFDAVFRATGKAFHAVATKIRERRAIAELSELDDRTLADIGISRSLIHHVAKKVAENPGVNYRIFTG